MSLDTVAKILGAFYRLTGTESDDPGLTEQGEETNEVAYLYLTEGCHNAQRWMLDNKWEGWTTRTPALAFSGTDLVDGGRYVDLPADFLRARGDEMKSALREQDGTPWGKQTDASEDHRRGNWYYFKGDRLWLTRTAEPPATVLLDYYFLHPTWTDAVTIDFPLAARRLIVAYAGDLAKEEYWLPGDQIMERRIERTLAKAQQDARRVARQSKQAREFQRAPRFGNRW